MSNVVDNILTVLTAYLAVLTEHVSQEAVERWCPAYSAEELLLQAEDKLQAMDIALAELDKKGLTAQLNREDDACLMAVCLHLRSARGDWSRTRVERVWRRMGGDVRMFYKLRLALFVELDRVMQEKPC